MTTPVPTGTETARPFLPAEDFALSKRFYEALGFTKVLDGDVAIFRIGASSFILQNYFDKESAGNFMMQLMVDDLDAWWAHIVSLDLPAGFGVPAPKPPEMQRGACGWPMWSIQRECSGTLHSAARVSGTTNSEAPVKEFQVPDGKKFMSKPPGHTLSPTNPMPDKRAISSQQLHLRPISRRLLS